MHQFKTFDFLAGETIPVNKPYRWTSFDVVNKVRYAVKKNLGIPKLRIGHAGTLDPLATGLLILCSGKHTKLIESFQYLEKEYSGIFQLGATTPSFDLETGIDHLYPYEHISLEDIQEVAASLTGEINQVPPVFSAIKIGGRRAFDFARKKEELLMKSRKVTVSSFKISFYEPPDVGFSIVCSKGTYIRSLARDFGIMLNSGAYLKSLHRDRIGHFESENAYDIDVLLNHIIEFGELSGEL
jgi:tRNA pseudouridine55 synthase